ncbi:hypothetical protein PDE_02024 [Penicillium oxalicum 114-2]|uniref:Uncharacterized protein n=1 Tax=Penicillium oxalicum (strain 114-2 / CGMCC 5302) TaxID=933388 RepID=S8AMH3_PENO1|nr:hypothetical protein PDE_02024 [Penicillium oxalicum 114-2]
MEPKEANESVDPLHSGRLYPACLNSTLSRVNSELPEMIQMQEPLLDIVDLFYPWVPQNGKKKNLIQLDNAEIHSSDLIDSYKHCTEHTAIPPARGKPAATGSMEPEAPAPVSGSSCVQYENRSNAGQRVKFWIVYYASDSSFEARYRVRRCARESAILSRAHGSGAKAQLSSSPRVFLAAARSLHYDPVS